MICANQATCQSVHYLAIIHQAQNKLMQACLIKMTYQPHEI